MNDCGKYREMISLMADGELSEPQKAELAAHIGICPDCRRLYDAFAFISFSLDDGAEPPESLLTGVMAGIRAEKPGPVPVKKRRPVWVSVAALAACLTLIVFAATKSGISGTNRASSAAGEMSVTARLYADSDVSDASASLPSESPSGEPAPVEPETATDGFSSAQYTPVTGAPETDKAGTDATAPPEDHFLNGAAITGMVPKSEQPLESGTRAVSGEDNVSMVRVFSGDVEEVDRDPIVTFTDEESIRFFMDLLEFSEAGDGISVSGDPVFVVNVTSDSGDYSVSVWIVEGRLCCMSDKDGVLYVAAGDAGDLFDFIASA